MSRKKSKKTAVPDEILAEGSGPVSEPRDGDSDGDAQVLADALSELSAPVDPVSDEPDVSDAADLEMSDADGMDGGDGEMTPEDPTDPEADAGDVALAGTLPTGAATMDDVQLRHLVEALIFAADRPIAMQRLRQLTRVSDVARLEQAIGELADQYRERGIALQQVSGGYQFRTNTTYSPWVQQLIAGRPVRLSRAQLETLAIVAYRQPITRPEIDEIRGVDSSATLRLLLDRALIRVLGKREEVGRPILYGTTKEFLDFFSLGDLRELPTLREYSELTAESRQVMSDRLGVPLGPETTVAVDAGELATELVEMAADTESSSMMTEQAQTFDPDVAEPGSEPNTGE